MPTGPTRSDKFRDPEGPVPLVGITTDGVDIAGDVDSMIHAADVREHNLEALEGIYRELRRTNAYLALIVGAEL